MSAVSSIDSKPFDRRRHQRVKLTLLGRYMLADRREYHCQTGDISPGGATLIAPVAGNIGERVVVYLEHLGRLEGSIVRLTENGFAITAKMPPMKLEKIADQLTWLVNRHALGLPEDRRHERIVPTLTRTRLTLSDDQQVAAKINDISLSGVSITVDVRPPVGTAVKVGETTGRVVRVYATGIAVEFSRMLAVETFGPDIRI